MLERFTKVISGTAVGRLPGAQAPGARSPGLMQMFAFALHTGMTTSQADGARHPEALWYAVRPRPGDPQPGSA